MMIETPTDAGENIEKSPWYPHETQPYFMAI